MTRSESYPTKWRLFSPHSKFHLCKSAAQLRTPFADMPIPPHSERDHNNSSKRNPKRNFVDLPDSNLIHVDGRHGIRRVRMIGSCMDGNCLTKPCRRVEVGSDNRRRIPALQAFEP